MESASLQAELIAIVASVVNDQPQVMTIGPNSALPSGPFAHRHRSLQAGLHDRIREQTGLTLGYLEQLYTFADRDRPGSPLGTQTISICYIGLTRSEPTAVQDFYPADEPDWRNWYDYFPWEDHRQGPPDILHKLIKQLQDWAEAASNGTTHRQRQRRIALAFGLEDCDWNDELVLQRYELLFEAGLAQETGSDCKIFGAGMFGDHRRILATAIARIRMKIRYRPVVFELLPDHFTLLQLQRTIEALAGVNLHKQNFRRLIEQQNLVEETGAVISLGSGRPAKLFRFRHTILEERAAIGSKLPITRS